MFCFRFASGVVVLWAQRKKGFATPVYQPHSVFLDSFLIGLVEIGFGVVVHTFRLTLNCGFRIVLHARVCARMVLI